MWTGRNRRGSERLPALGGHLRRPLAALVAVVVLATVVVGARQVTAEIRGDQQAQPFSVTVDRGVVPPVAELPGFEEGTPRPVASIVAEDGSPAEFVENELILATDDEAQLAAFLARWRGEVLATFDPAGHDLDELTTRHLIRVDTRDADRSALAADLRALEADLGGAHRVSSDTALGLLAAGARAAASGLPVGVNWVLRGEDFRDRVSNEAPEGPAGYDPNAFTWPTHSSGSEQDIGVAEAWRALDYGGKLDNRVKLAILDSGFQPDADTPARWQAVSNIPFRDATGTPNPGFCPGPCDWHGTNVVSAGIALAGNDFGSAGPGGPVAEPILVNTIMDQFSLVTALGKAAGRGAKIANLSGGVPVPVALAWSVWHFEAATWAFHKSGLLIFAAAGNSGKNVDAGRCIRSWCVEWTWHTPCENRGVICVGGLDQDSKRRHPNSNYGDRDVDIFAPYVHWVGPDPYLPEGANQAQQIVGTSYASPFVAGVAALVWAANPDLSAGEVASILTETAHPSPDGKVRRYVNALAAVQAASSVPPDIVFVTPEPGAQVPLDVPVNFSAVAHDFEDGDYCCRLVWAVRNAAGNYIGVGRGDRVSRTFTSAGAHTLHVRATDSDGTSRWASITVAAVNQPPSVEITRPGPGEQLTRGQPYLLRATAADPNEPGGQLACDRLRWTSSIAEDPFPLTGCSPEVTFATTGERTLTVTATDSRGGTGTAQVSLTVAGGPPGGPAPTVRITAPVDGDTIYELPRALTLNSESTDPAGGGLDHTWSVTYPYDPATGTGPTTEVISPQPLRPFGARWLPADTFDTETWCGLDGRLIRLNLEVVDAGGRRGSDHIVLRTYPCVVVD
jgi:hypothetical protein